MQRHQRALRHLARQHVMVLRSTRPILRQAMIDRLRERITTMFHERIRW
jgi:hypothetical protein